MQNPREPLRRELVSWAEVDKLIDLMIPQIRSVGRFDGMIIITRGGIIPGGLLAEALNISYVMTAAVRFNDPVFNINEFQLDTQPALLGLPSFLQFPENRLLEDRKLLIVDDVWGSGRTSLSVKGRCEVAGAVAYTTVLHFNPYRSLFDKAEPNFYGAITDAFVIYPWEVDRGIEGIGAIEPQV